MCRYLFGVIKMKRQIGICIILAIIVVILALLYIKINNESNTQQRQDSTENSFIPTEESTTHSTISSNEYETYYFYAKNDNGRVSIYDIKSHTLYMETGIEIVLLPEEIQSALEVGIYFKTEVELFDFLESYSS